MSGYKVGDRVKVTIEGEVYEDDGDDGHLYLNDLAGRYAGYLKRAARGVTIEKLPDPLPTTPGSLIRLKSTNPIYRTLHEDGLWHPNVNGTPPYAPEELAPERWDVVYDAGKA